MIEVNYLRIDSQFDNYVSKLCDEAKAKNKTFDKPTSLLFKNPFIVLIDELNIDSMKTLIDDRNEKFIVAFQTKKDFKLIEKLKKDLDKVFGFLDLSLDVEFNVPLLKNYLNSEYSTSVLNLEKLNKDLEKILEFTQTELSRVKEMHDRFVKLRTEKLRGGKIQIKFMAGEKSGGEFFDFLEKDNKLFIFSAGTDSYITSSLLITEIEILKAQEGNVSTSIPSLIKKMINIAEENNSKLNYLVTVFNMNTLEVDYFQRGNSKVYNGEKILNISGDGKFKLHRGEKLFFLSEGLLRNWNLANKESELEKFLNAHKEMNNKDFINELFFELVKNKNSSFLQFDALMGVVEIDEYVIHQV